MRLPSAAINVPTYSSGKKAKRGRRKPLPKAVPLLDTSLDDSLNTSSEAVDSPGLLSRVSGMVYRWPRNLARALSSWNADLFAPTGGPWQAGRLHQEDARDAAVRLTMSVLGLLLVSLAASSRMCPDFLQPGTTARPTGAFTGATGEAF